MFKFVVVTWSNSKTFKGSEYLCEAPYQDTQQSSDLRLRCGLKIGKTVSTPHFNDLVKIHLSEVYHISKLITPKIIHFSKRHSDSEANSYLLVLQTFPADRKVATYCVLN